MDIPRRTFLKGVIATSSMMTLSTIVPMTVMADWSKIAFEATTTEKALMALFVKNTDKIIIETSTIAELGEGYDALLPIEVTVNLPKVESIAIIVEKNQTPLVALFNLNANTEAWVRTRIKIAETSDVIVVVKADGKLYTTCQNVEVITGECGCGG
ncbi:thiosulfate oxidation carrier protein SoxY [Candidatus Parabeggiatoa sp. HSG14]|uniref:thiosulfate oxidation carrier protein SoxY n=1 Tax=Candidatus Parabeggiatoa sp. HSG14 TaxID=3055593 RepID=UPI0025A70BD8|nr:thiosulfate oxidation carrier protein SoxY [Thiotrichales bacterium HSG14]